LHKFFSFTSGKYPILERFDLLVKPQKLRRAEIEVKVWFPLANSSNAFLIILAFTKSGSMFLVLGLLV
jgi:hypothetical protein